MESYERLQEYLANIFGIREKESWQGFLLILMVKLH